MTNRVRSFRGTPLLVAFLCIVIGQSAWVDSGMRTEQVQFAKDASSAVINGTLKGSQTVDYVRIGAVELYENSDAFVFGG